MPSGIFDPVEVLALYLSALGHDAGHFRLNNAFLKNSKHALYKKYKESVLENFHLGLLFELLEDDQVGIVEFLAEEDRDRFRDIITTLILATDMAKHMGLFKQLQSFLAEARDDHREMTFMHDSLRSLGSRGGYSDGDSADTSPAGTPRTSYNAQANRRDSENVNPETSSSSHEPWVRPAIDGADKGQRMLVMQLLLKCADLGNVVRPLEIADTWGKRIMEEFYQQGEKELTLGLPLTTFPNRKNFDYIFARHQSGFLVNVVRPLFDVFTTLVDFDTREAVIGSAAENGNAWMRRENENRPRKKKNEEGEGDKKTNDESAKSTSDAKRNSKVSKLTRQSTMGWVQTVKHSNLTMLTANAMEMKGLHFRLDESYGASDEAAAAVRFLMPFVQRSELARLARNGILETSTSGSELSVTSDNSKAMSPNFYGKLSSRSEFDAAVVVATFDGFLELERRASDEAEAEVKLLTRSKETAKEMLAKIRERCANAFGNALSSVLAKAVDSVHACGGDVVHMGHDGLVCVFPLSGASTNKSSSTGADMTKSPIKNAPDTTTDTETSDCAGAALRATRCAFTLVSQLSSVAPEIAGVGDAHNWPGLRRFSKGTRVMVVESLQLSRMAMGRLLDHFGCMTHFAENASQAAAACANMEFDVILMNVLLHGNNGYELARHIRAHGGPVNGRAYIAAVTYVQQPELLDQCLGSGMNEVIVKPATMQTLRNMFRRAKQRAREMRKQDAMRSHSFSSSFDGNKGSQTSNSGSTRFNSVDRQSVKEELVVVQNPYSLGGGRMRVKRVNVNRSQKQSTLSRNVDVQSLDDLTGTALNDVSLTFTGALGPHHSNRLMHNGTSGGTGRHNGNDNAIPVHLPKFADMLMSAGRVAVRDSIIGDTFGSSNHFPIRSLDDNAIFTSTDPKKKISGTFGRFLRALCGYDDDSRTREERLAIHERSAFLASGKRASSTSNTSDTESGRRSVDDGSGSVDRASASGFAKAGATLARYKSTKGGLARSGSTEKINGPNASPQQSGVFDTIEGDESNGDDLSDDDFEMNDFELNVENPLPVAISVTAAVGFGRVSDMRIGTSCVGVLESDRNENPEKSSNEKDSVVKRAMLSADRDVVVACDAVLPSSSRTSAAVATAAAASRGPSEGGPFQQTATLIRMATAGDVTLSPAAWRLVRENCDGDTPPVLRGGARLNRIRVHEVVPPLTNHALAPHQLALLVPTSPDPTKALHALASLVPRPVRQALADRANAAALSIQRKLDRHDAGISESEDESGDDGADTETPEKHADELRKLPMPSVKPRAVEVVTAVVYLPGPSSGANSRVAKQTSQFQNTLTSATAAVMGLLLRFPGGSLTRVCNDVLFGRDVDKKTGGGGGGGDGMVLYCDFAPPLPKGNDDVGDNGDQTSVSERRAAATAAATAFALAARAAMVHLGHVSSAAGVASGRAVTMAAGSVDLRCEWTTTGDVVSRAERLAAFADAEVLCDLRVVKQCAGSGIIDFDPVPHAAGDDVARARNLSAGHLDRIIGIAGASGRDRSHGYDFSRMYGDNSGSVFSGSSLLGRSELTERSIVSGDGLAPGPCVLMPHGTREAFGDTSKDTKNVPSHSEKESGAKDTAQKSKTDADEDEKVDGDDSNDNLNPIMSKITDDELITKRTDELEAKEAAEKLSYSALAALSLASASAATVTTLENLMNKPCPKNTPAPPALVAHETTLLAAKRVIAEAQEAMAPRLFFLEGPARAGKSRAANAVLDLPEVRRLWLLRTRGAHAVDEVVKNGAGGGAALTSSGSFALASFTNLFHQLLGFSTQATSRERKAAVVELLEGCGSEKERLGRYAKPILEILGIEKADGLQLDDDEDDDVVHRGSLRSNEHDTGSYRMNTSDTRHSSKTSKSLRGEKTTLGRGIKGGLSLQKPEELLKEALSDSDTEKSEKEGLDVSKQDSKPKLQASRLGREKSVGGESLDAPSQNSNAHRLGGFLDSVSQAAMDDASRFLCRDVMDLLVGDGLGQALEHNDHEFNHDGCDGHDHEDGEHEHGGKHHGRHASDSDADDELEHGHSDDDKISDSDQPQHSARAVIMGKLTGTVAFTRQRNGVQRRDYNKRFRAVLHRRKNTLASLLVSTGGISQLCSTLALMLERLLLGRSVQAAPAQPSLPGWMLLVEDAQWLDPLSMGLIRALLERASIPLVIMMTHACKVEDAQNEIQSQHASKSSQQHNPVGASIVNRRMKVSTSINSTQHATDISRPARLSTVDESIRGGDQNTAGQNAGNIGGFSSGDDDVWGTRGGVSANRSQDSDAQRWLRKDLDWMLELYSTTVVDVAPLSRSDLRVFVEECASRALSVSENLDDGVDRFNNSSSSELDSSERSTTDTTGDGGDGDGETFGKSSHKITHDSANSNDRTRSPFGNSRHQPSSSTAKSLQHRRAGGGARSVGLPSAIHAEIYKHTKGDPLHAASLANLLVSCGAVSLQKSAQTGVPEVIIKTNEDVVEVSTMPARDATIFSLEKRLSKDALSALKTLAASGSRIRTSQAHELVARRLAIRDKETMESRESIASVFRREFVSNLAVGVVDGDKALTNPILGYDSKDGHSKESGVADPRAIALVYGAVRSAGRASDAITELVRAGVLQLDWGSLSDARDASQNARAEAAVAFAVADVPFPLGDSIDENASSRRTSMDLGHSAHSVTDWLKHNSRHSVKKHSQSSSRRSRHSSNGSDIAPSTSNNRHHTNSYGFRRASSRVPWLTFANDDVRRYSYESQANWRRRAAHLDATRVLRDEAQYCIRGDVVAVALIAELAARHLAQAQMVDKALVVNYMSRQTIGGGGGDARPTQRPGSDRNCRVSFDGPSSHTAAVVAAERVGGFTGGAGGFSINTPNKTQNANNWSDANITAREILLAASGLWQRVRFHEDICAAHMTRGTIRAAILSASALSLAAATWAEVSKDMHRAFGKRYPRLVESVSLSNEDGKALLVRNAAWSLTIARLVLELGAGSPPFFNAEFLSAEDQNSPLHHARRCFLSLDLKWPFDKFLNSSGGGIAAELTSASENFAILPMTFLSMKLSDGSVDEVLTGRSELGGSKPFKVKHAIQSVSPFNACFKPSGVGSKNASGAPGLPGLDAAMRRALSSLFASCERRDDRPRTWVGDTGRGALRDPGGHQNMDGSVHHVHRSVNSNDKTEKESLYNRLEIAPLGEGRPGVGDILRYATQIKPRSSRDARRFAQNEIALAACADVSLAAVFSGRPGVAAAAVVRHAKAFIDAPAPTPTDCALLLNLIAAVMPESSSRVFALRRAEEILDAEAVELRRVGEGVDVEQDPHAKQPQIPSKHATLQCNLSTTMKRALSGKRVRFAETPPSPRSGPALCARAMACCARGDWVSARAAAASSAALLERPGESDLRLCDVARCLGAAAEVHLGRWESANACVFALAHDREGHGEIGPVVLALRLAAKTASCEYTDAVRLWRDSLKREPFKDSPLGAGNYAEASRVAKKRQADTKDGNTSSTPRKNTSSPQKTMDSRDYPAYVCCRAFAAQALWSSGERQEAVVLLEQILLDQLPSLQAPSHFLLPAAALAAGETASRACRVGAFDKKIGKLLLQEAHGFLHNRANNVLPFSVELAARLREVAPAGFL